MICVDASVATKWILSEPRSNLAVALVQACWQARRPVLAPPLLTFEVANVVRKRMIRDGLSLTVARRLVRRFATYPVTMLTLPDLSDRALRIAHAHGLPAVYDAHYVALAQAVGCDLWTDDQQLVRTLSPTLPLVRWIGAYQPGGPF